MSALRSMMGKGDVLTAADLQEAYGVTEAAKTGGRGHRVYVLTPAHLSMSGLEADLDVYRQANDISRRCTFDDGCLTDIDQYGLPVDPNTPATNDAGYIGEAMLDVEMVSAVCPNCDITVMETPDANPRALVTLKALDAKWVSNSMALPKWSVNGEAAWVRKLDSAFRWDGIVYTQASGDEGYESPSSWTAADSPRVIGVGGTVLTWDDGGQRWNEAGWNFSGSRCATGFGKPGWQQPPVVPAGVCDGRATADISAVAKNVLMVKNATPDVVGGTSAAAPIVAGIAALADAPAGNQRPPAYLYANWDAHPGLVRDVTEGPATGTCGGTVLCKPGPGWDGPTGIGTPQGPKVFQPPKTLDTRPIVIQSAGGGKVDGCLGTVADRKIGGFPSVWKTDCGAAGWQQHWRYVYWNGDAGVGRHSTYSLQHLNADGDVDGCLTGQGEVEQMVLTPCSTKTGRLDVGELFRPWRKYRLLFAADEDLAIYADYNQPVEPVELREQLDDHPAESTESWKFRHVDG